jgi:ribonucleoside-diphosphate reductase alpha chain
MDSFATTVSVALQYGVPLHDLVHKFAHVRFEPSGFTSNPEIPIAKSIIDYIFRWLGSRFLPPEDRATLGLVDRSAASETSVQPLNLGLGAAGGIGSAGTSGSGSGASAPHDAAGPASPLSGNAGQAGTSTTAVATSTPRAGGGASSDAPRFEAAPQSGNGHGSGSAPGTNGNGKTGSPAGLRAALGNIGVGKNQVTFAAQADAPSCAECGSIMVRNGSCYKCLNCGSTSGCS